MKLPKKRLPSRRKRRMIHHYFIPGAHNAHRPQFLEFQAIAINVAIVVLLFLIAHGVLRLVFTAPSEQVGAVIAAVLVDLANEDRSVDGLPALVMSPTLQEAAQMKADDMAGKEYFAHESPEGFDPWHWFEQAGYDFRFAGENLAVYFSDSAEVESAWMNSPKHRANILSSHFSEIGIALAHGRYQGYDTTFVVQMFGAPAQAGAVAIAGSSPSSDGSSRVAGATASALETIVEDEMFIAVKWEGEALAAVSDGSQPVGALKDGADSTNPFWRIATAPKTTLQYIYMALAALVLLVMSLMFLSGLRRMHVPSLIRGIGLLALIGFLLWSGTLLSGELLIL